MLMDRTRVCVLALISFCVFVPHGRTEEASCPKRYDPGEGSTWTVECKKGDVMAVYFSRQDEADLTSYCCRLL